MATWWEHRLCASLDNDGHRTASLDALESWLLEVIDQLEVQHCRRDCPIGTLAADMHDTDNTTRVAVGQCFKALESHLHDVLRRIRQQGELSEDANLEALTHFILASQQGAATLTKAHGESRPGCVAITQAMQYVRAHSASAL